MDSDMACLSQERTHAQQQRQQPTRGRGRGSAWELPMSCVAIAQQLSCIRRHMRPAPAAGHRADL